MIIVDQREPSGIPARLRELGVDVEVRQISPGDYVVGEVAVERKTISDFLRSIVTKRIFDQMLRLREAYPVPVILVEGDLAEISEQKNPRAFWGAILAFTLREHVTMFFTPDLEQTCQLLVTLHKRTGAKADEYGIRHKPKLLTLGERQRFLLQGLPTIGETLSENLLSHFGTPRAVFAANEHSLAKVPKIGRAKAGEIAKVLDTAWEGHQKRLDQGDETV